MGLGVAKMLTRKGYYVFATYVDPDFTGQIEDLEVIKTNQTNREDVYKFIDYVKSKTVHLDCLHCNAGMNSHTSLCYYRGNC